MKFCSSVALLSLLSVGSVYGTLFDESVENKEVFPFPSQLNFAKEKSSVSKKGHIQQRLVATYENSPCYNIRATLKYDQHNDDKLVVSLKLKRQAKPEGTPKINECKMAFYPWTEAVGTVSFNVPTTEGEHKVNFPVYLDLSQEHTSYVFNTEINSVTLDSQRTTEVASIEILDPAVAAVEMAKRDKPVGRFVHKTGSEENSPFKLVFPDGETITADKSVMKKAHFFKKLFKKDATLEQADIKEFDIVTMKALVEFVRTGRIVEFKPTSWSKLFEAAKFYGVESLGGVAVAKNIEESIVNHKHVAIEEYNFEPSHPFYPFLKDVNEAVDQTYTLSAVKTEGKKNTASSPTPSVEESQ